MSACVSIKDLKDLDNVTTRFSIDIKDLKDLKRHRLTMEIAGDRSALSLALRLKTGPFTVGRGPSQVST